MKNSFLVKFKYQNSIVPKKQKKINYFYFFVRSSNANNSLLGMGRNWDSKRWLKYINYRKKISTTTKNYKWNNKKGMNKNTHKQKKFIVIHKHVVLTPSVILSNVTSLNIF